MRKGAEVANHSSKYKEQTKKCHRRKGKTKKRQKTPKPQNGKTVKKKHKRKKKTSLHIHIRKQKHRTLKNSLTVHAAHTQISHSLICISHLWLMHLQMQGRNTNTSGAGKKSKKKRTQSRHATHNTPVNRTCPRVLTSRVAPCCLTSNSDCTYAHTDTNAK